MQFLLPQNCTNKPVCCSLVNDLPERVREGQDGLNGPTVFGAGWAQGRNFYRPMTMSGLKNPYLDERKINHLGTGD